jgi:hypothetical protein
VNSSEAVSNNLNRLDHPSSLKIEVIDLELNTKTTYNSMLAATRALNLNSAIISKYIKRNQISPYLIKRGTYLKKYSLFLFLYVKKGSRYGAGFH